MISRASKSSVLQGFAKSRSMLAGNEAYFPSDYEFIAKVSGSANSFTFSNIPSTYTHLQIRGIGQNAEYYNGSASYYIQFNGDTGSNYSSHGLYGNGTSALSDGGGTYSYVYSYQAPRINHGTNNYGVFIMDILDYKNTSKYKTTRILSGFDINGATTPYMGLFGGNWRNTSAITSINIAQTYPQYGFSGESTFALYGIKAD